MSASRDDDRPDEPSDNSGRDDAAGVSRRNFLTAASAATGAGLGAMSGGVPSAHAATVNPSLDDGSLLADPGDVQATLDKAASLVDRPRHNVGRVRLDPSKEYMQSSSPWVVPKDVVLDFGGAVLLGNGEDNDVDIIHLEPRAQVHNPKINLVNDYDGYHASNLYRGNVFVLDSTEYGSYFADGTTIKGGWTMGIGGGGTWMYIRAGKSVGQNHVTCIRIDTNIRRQIDITNHTFETGIHLDSRGEDGFLNSIWFRGVFRGLKTLILQEGEQPNNNHIFEGIFQQKDDADHLWRIKPGTFARGSVVRGKVWDVNSGTYPGGAAWAIESSNEGCHSNAIRGVGGFPTELVENNSGNDHYITDLNTNQTTTV